MECQSLFTDENIFPLCESCVSEKVTHWRPVINCNLLLIYYTRENIYYVNEDEDNRIQNVSVLQAREKQHIDHKERRLL